MHQSQRRNYFLRLNLAFLGDWFYSDYILLLIIISIGILSTVLGGLCYYNKETSKDTKRWPVSQLLFFCSLIFSLVSILLIKLRSLKQTFIISLIFLVLIPILLFISLYFSNNLSLFTALVLISTAVLSVLSLIFRAVNSISRSSYHFIGPALVSSLCLSLVLIFLIFPTYVVLMSQEINNSIIFQLISIVSSGVFILLLSPWLYFQFKYFNSKKSYATEIFPDADLNSKKILIVDSVLRYGSGLIIFVVYSCCLLVCIIGIGKDLQKGYSEKIMIYFILLLAAPIYLYCGIFISKAKTVTETKMYIFTLLYGVLPLGATLPVYIFFEEYQFVTKFLVVLPPFAMIIQGFIALKAKPKTKFNIVFSFACLTIVFPVGFIYPLVDSEIIPFTFGLLLIVALGAAPVIFSIWFLIHKFQIFFKYNAETRLQKIKELNLYYPTLYLIMLIFTFGEGTLIYVFCSELDETPGHASLLGMIFFLPFVYTGSSMTLQLKITSEDQAFNSSLKQKFQILSFVFCALVVPISIILMFALEFVGIYFTAVMKSICIGLSLFCPLVIVLLQIKFRLGKFYPQLPMLLSNVVLWVLFIIPICIIFPIYLSRTESSMQRNKYIGVLIIYLGILIMIFVSTASIIYNAYKNKMSRDKLARKCVIKVQELFSINRIKSSQKVVRDMFDRFAHIKFDGEKFKEKLLKKESQFDWMEVGESEKAFFFMEILTYEEVKERKEKKIQMEKIQDEEKKNEIEKKEKEKREKKPSFWVLLRCFDAFPDELDFTPPPVYVPKVVELNDLRVESIEPIPQCEFEKIIPVDYDIMREPLPPPVEIARHPRSRVFADTSSLENLKNDRSSREDWLKSMFRFVANEPNDISAEPWISESQFFYLCRNGGIDSDKVNDIDLRIIYIKSLTEDQYEILNENVFVEKVIPLIAEALYKDLDNVTRERKLVIEMLFPNLLKNIHGMLEDPEFMNAKGKVDSLQETLRRTFTFQADALRKGSVKRKPTILKGLVSRTLPMRRSSQESLSEFTLHQDFSRISNDNDENFEYHEGKLMIFCKRLGDWFTFTGIKIADKIMKKLQDFYTPAKPEEDHDDNDQNKAKVGNKSQSSELESENDTPLIEWDDVCTKFIHEVTEINKKDELKKQIEPPSHIQLNFSNILAIIFKIIEIIQLSSLGFKKEINWKFFVVPLSLSKSAEVANSDPDSNTIYIFWVLFAMTLIYGLLGYRSFDQIKKGTMAKNEDGKKLGIRTTDFWKKRFLVIFGGGLYIFVVKYMMNIYACEFDIDPPRIPKAYIECYTSWHIGLMVCAFICLMVYYPIATFLFPLMQFNDSDLDFKQKQTYLIVLAQAKLLISGFKVFLPYTNYYEYQLFLSSIVLFLVFLYTTVERPCAEKRFNLWSSFGYFFAAATNFFAYLNVKLGGSDTVTLSYFSIIGISFISVIIIQAKLYGFWIINRVESISIIKAHRNSLLHKSLSAGEGGETSNLKEGVSMNELDHSNIN